MRLRAYLHILLTKIFAIFWSVVIVAMLVGEILGHHLGQRPLTATELLIFALSIPFGWLVYVITRRWTGFLDKRGI